MVRRLTQLGYMVLEASSGLQAITAPGQVSPRYQARPFRCDVMISHMNGRQAVEAIQAIRPSLKALYMSGYPADVIADDGVVKRKGVAFIEKADLVSDLPRRIRELLESKCLT